MTLTEEQVLRYSRQIILPQVGGPGQTRLAAAKVLVVGAGGLGSPAALYLAAAGIGTLGLCDADHVDLTNLQRQILHGTPDVGRPKVDSAAETLERLNPDVIVHRHPVRLTAANALDLLPGYDMVVDGTDTFPSKFLVNDACVIARVPYVFAGILGFEGQLLTVVPGEGPCYRCFFREAPPPGSVPTCAQAGIVGAVAGILGSLQALETMKVILGIGTPAVGRLKLFDGLALTWREIKVHPDPTCPACGDPVHHRPLSGAPPGICA